MLKKLTAIVYYSKWGESLDGKPMSFVGKWEWEVLPARGSEVYVAGQDWIVADILAPGSFPEDGRARRVIVKPK